MALSILFAAFSGIAMIISFLQLYSLLTKEEFYDFVDALDNFLESESLTKKDITQTIYNDDGTITVVIGEGENKREVTLKKTNTG